jgi:protein-tyrosine phosphatase
MEEIAGGGQVAAVGWDGAVNAWRIAGDVYRMGRREWLTELGWKQAYDAGIRTVVDLRNAAERQRRDTDPMVNVEVMEQFHVVLAPTEDPENVEFRSVCRPYLSDPAAYLANARLFPDKLASVFKAVASSRGGVIIHCSAGRDRSGMIAAMLQDLAGAQDGEIVAGYQAAMRGINERHRTHGVPHAHEAYLEEAVLMPLLESRGERLLEFVRQLDTRNFLRENDVTDEEFSAIKAILRGRVTV